MRYACVWQTSDAAAEADALDFWRGSALLPPGVDENIRAKQLCIVARQNTAVAGISTIEIRRVAILQGQFAMFRCAVAPEHRRGGLAAELAVRSRDAMEAWALANIQHQLLGMACVVQGPELTAKKAQPLWPLSRLGLIGYNNRGEQIRVVWFRHASVA